MFYNIVLFRYKLFSFAYNLKIMQRNIHKIVIPFKQYCIMKSFLRKYIDNNLSNSELLAFRTKLNSSADNEISGYLQEFWAEETGESISHEVLIALKKEIDRKIGKQKLKQGEFWKTVSRAAAIIAIPLLIFTAYHTYRQTPAKVITNMIVSVGPGERVNMVLPDGTKVNLNAETTLSYDISTFNKKFREISLSGEAYFEVANNERIPFLIETGDLDVEVLGTSFNLSAREEDAYIELSLLEGKVHLRSTKSQEDVVLYSNQLATLNKETGKISISKVNNNASIAWRKDELVFKATPISKVLREIERSYGITIQMNPADEPLDDLFTGTFSTKNLNETFSILQLHYRFNYVIKGNVVHVDDFKLNKKQN